MSNQHSRSQIETATGLAAGVLGVGAVLFVLGGPLYSVASSGVASDGTVSHTFGTETLLQAGLDPVTAVVLGVALLASVGIGLGAVLHARTGASFGRGVVAVSTVALIVVAILGALSIGIFLLPSVGLGFVALAAGARPSPAIEAWPHP
jgi:hypothetical protein